jgi:hypothetical protein
MYQHHSRDVIMKIIEDEGRPLYPREIHAKTAMGYPALRKLMRQMLKGVLYQDAEGRYGLLASLSQKQINAAPQAALHAELRLRIDSHRDQRHTQPTDINAVLRRLLKESEAGIRKIDVNRIEIKIVIATPTSCSGAAWVN